MRNFQSSVSSEQIMKTFNFKPSKEISIIKEAIIEVILEGETPNKYSAAYNYMLEKGKILGLNL